MNSLSHYYSRLVALDGVFTPSAPIEALNLFAGRKKEIDKVTQAILESGSHPIIYGERGVGKTSLVNIIGQILEAFTVYKARCDTSDNFTTLWQKVFASATITYQKSENIGFESQPQDKSIKLLDLLPPQIYPKDVAVVLKLIKKDRAIFIFDEFDRLSDETTKILFADAIKMISDDYPQLTVIIVGVGETVNELIGSHPSVERNLKQIKLPTMSKEELAQIIKKGVDKLSVTIDEKYSEAIVKFSSGYPHFTHLITKNIIKSLYDANREAEFLPPIDDALFNSGILMSIETSQESLRESFRKATIATRDNIYKEVLYAAAIAKTDEYDTFSAKDLEKPLSTILGRKITLYSFVRHLDILSSENRGRILLKFGSPKRYRYRLRNPMVKGYLLMKLYGLKGKIPAFV